MGKIRETREVAIENTLNRFIGHYHTLELELSITPSSLLKDRPYFVIRGMIGSYIMAIIKFGLVGGAIVYLGIDLFPDIEDVQEAISDRGIIRFYQYARVQHVGPTDELKVIGVTITKMRQYIEDQRPIFIEFKQRVLQWIKTNKSEVYYDYFT